MLDPEAFGAAMGDLIREAIEPLHKQIEDLRLQIKEAPDFELIVAAEVERRLAAMPVPRDGKDVDMAQVEAVLEKALKSFEDAGSAAIKALPIPKDGKDGTNVTIGDIQPVLDAAIKDMAATAAATIDAAVKAIPVPKDGDPGKDGASITLSDVRPILDEAVKAMGESAAVQVNAAICAIPVPKDGADGKDGTSVTLEDVTGVLEIAVNKWALEFERRAQDTIQKSLDKIVQPKDGEPGKDGRDGMGFDDLQVEYDGEKTITLKMQKGDVIKEANIVMPIVIDKGIYKDGQSYLPGDGVTWAGSYWICKSESAVKPDSADSGWRLAVKRGRDGKDGINGIDKTAPVKL